MNPSKKTVTIKYLANRLNLSPTTVSYVLSGQAEKRQVAQKTALRVQKTAESMGYVPNIWARSLRSNRSRNISIIIDDLSKAWSDKIIKEISLVLDKHNYTVSIVIDWRNEKLLEKEIDAILQRRDEGVICHPHALAKNQYMLLLERKIPLVFVSDVPVAMSNMNAVLWDDRLAIEAAINHLINNNRKRIAFVGYRHGLLSDERRYNTYLKTLKKANMPMGVFI